MSVVSDAVASLEAALRSVDGVRYYRDPAGQIDPPATLLGPVELAWEAAGCGGPTGGTWRVYVVHALDSRAAERLPELVLLVAGVLDELPEAAVLRADPGVFVAGGQELPSYEITVEVAL